MALSAVWIIVVVLLGLEFTYAEGKAIGSATEKEFPENVCGDRMVVANPDGSIVLQKGGLDLHPNQAMEGYVEEAEYQHYQICVPKHLHEHLVTITLEPVNCNVNIYASVTNRFPRVAESSWIAQSSGRNILKLPTYLDGFPLTQYPVDLNIGVYGKRNACKYTIIATIEDLKETQDLRDRREWHDKMRLRSAKLRGARQLFNKYDL